MVEHTYDLGYPRGMVVSGTGPFGRNPEFYCFDGIRMTERAPLLCPLGHPLGRDRMLVGSHPCLCAGTSHRTWRCRTCDAVWISPACLTRPNWPVWQP